MQTMWDSVEEQLEPIADKPGGERGRGIAEEALKIINGKRQVQHGKPENSFWAIARLWNAYLDNRQMNRALCDYDVANLMMLFKLGRLQTGTESHDSTVDLLGYALLGAIMRGEK